MEPPSPIHGLRASQPFPSRFINRTNENREMRVLSYVKQQAASAFMRFKRITKENGFIYRYTRERADKERNPTLIINTNLTTDKTLLY